MVEKFKKQIDFEFSTMENFQFPKMVQDVIRNATQDENFLLFETPIGSKDDFVTNICLAVSIFLVQNGFYCRHAEDKDKGDNNVIILYFSKEGIVIYCTITKEVDLRITEYCFVFRGREDLISGYRTTLQVIIDRVLQESSMLKHKS